MSLFVVGHRHAVREFPRLESSLLSFELDLCNAKKGTSDEFALGSRVGLDFRAPQLGDTNKALFWNRM